MLLVRGTFIRSLAYWIKDLPYDRINISVLIANNIRAELIVLVPKQYFADVCLYLTIFDFV